MTLYGPDISKWQAGLIPPPDPHIGFGMCRASIGENTDPVIGNALAWAKQHAVPFAAYHFVYTISNHPADDQAATFHGAVGGDTTIYAMLDWESDGSQQPDFDDVVAVAEAIRALGHRCALVYTGQWYWSSKGSPTMAGHGLDLIDSSYGSNAVGSPTERYDAQGGDSGEGWTPYGGLTPVIWQFGSQIEWGNQTLDFNAYKGDPAALDNWFTTWGASPPPPTPSPSQLTTPPGSPTLKRGVEHSNVPWLQTVLSTMPTLPADGGTPIYNPDWIGADHIGSQPQDADVFGDATYNAVVYWQSKNHDVDGNQLAADGIYGNVTAAAMAKVRGE